MDVKYDVHQIIERYPNLDSFVTAHLQEWESVNPQPHVETEIPRKPYLPLAVVVSTQAGLLTFKPISSGCADLLIKPDEQAPVCVRLDMNHIRALLEAVIEAEAQMNYLHEWMSYYSKPEKDIATWKGKRHMLAEKLETEWREAWDEYCEAKGIKWCSDCGEIEASKDGYCSWCHPDVKQLLRYPHIVTNRFKRPYLRFVLLGHIGT